MASAGVGVVIQGVQVKSSTVNPGAAPVDQVVSAIQAAQARRERIAHSRAARNTPLVACVSGTITSTTPTDTGLGGITIHLKGGNTTYYYAHLSSLKDGIHAGAKVSAGDVIGYAGNTGNASGGAVHLHFEIRPNGVAIDPYPTLVKYR